MNRVKVLIADDHELIRLGIRMILNSERGVQIVAEAGTGTEAVQQATKFRPDVVILDLAMPDCDGIEAGRQIQGNDPGTRVIILSMHDSDVIVRKAFFAGANAYVLKSDLPSKLRLALRTVCEGRRYLSPELSERLASSDLRKSDGEKDASPNCLTCRELEIARLLSVGKSSKQIGEVLGISIRTVETHRANIMRKLHAHSVTELIHSALIKGLIDVHDEEMNMSSRSRSAQNI